MNTQECITAALTFSFGGRHVDVERVDSIVLPKGMKPSNALAGIGNSYVEPLPGTMTTDYRYEVL